MMGVERLGGGCPRRPAQPAQKGTPPEARDTAASLVDGWRPHWRWQETTTTTTTAQRETESSSSVVTNTTDVPNDRNDGNRGHGDDQDMKRGHAKPVLPPTVPGHGHAAAVEHHHHYAATAASTSSLPAAPMPAPPARRDSASSLLSSRRPPLAGSAQFLPRKQQHAILAGDDQGIDMTLSPGRESLGHDSTASCVTVSSSASYSRNSTTSIDSGRESFRGPGSTFAPHPAPPVAPIRQSIHSSSSSLGSLEARGDPDSICSLNVREMVASGLPALEIVNAWLTDLNFEEYFDYFASAGYDMQTISRMTPEDLTAIGIQKPNHRKRLKSEIAKLNIDDGIPSHIPGSVDEWLSLIRLSEYGPLLRSQGYDSLYEMMQISVEDLEDVGIFKLGHQKRFLLAIKRLKVLKCGRPGANTSPAHRPLTVHTTVAPRPAGEQFPSRQHHLYKPSVIQIKHYDAIAHQADPLTESATGVPQPMRPLSGFAKYNSFQQQQQQLQIHKQQHPLALSAWKGSLDDASVLRQTTNSFCSQAPSGSTLPRPKCLVRPVAKVAATTNGDGFVVEVADGAYAKPSLASVASVPQNTATTSIPNASADSLVAQQTKEGSCDSQPRRNAGDVLCDIGAMLADLTDELDSMLKTDRDYVHQFTATANPEQQLPPPQQQQEEQSP